MSLEASDAVRAEWGRRVEAEYRSAAITQHLGLWLIQLGASPDLIRDALRIVDDEMVHAEMSHDVLLAAGGDGAPPIDRSTLGLRRHPERPLEEVALRAGVRIFCLGETVAVPLFAHLRKGCEEPTARAALDRVLLDEVRHRDFGWELLGWFLELPGADTHRAQVERELPDMFAELEAAYGRGDFHTDSVPEEWASFSETDRAWGLAPPSEYAEILTRTFERDYQPRFAALGIDAAPAWERRAEED